MRHSVARVIWQSEVSIDLGGEIQKWFNRFLGNYSGFNFSVKHICFHNLFNIVGSNVVSEVWGFSDNNKNMRSFCMLVSSALYLIKIENVNIFTKNDLVYLTGLILCFCLVSFRL